MDFTRPETVLNLANIRDSLVRMEDTILFAFIERLQFYAQPSLYVPGAIPIPNFSGSFLEWSLLQLEVVQSQLRRYESPDEIAFFPDELKESFLPPLGYPPVLAKYHREVTVNDRILEVYVKEVVPLISAGAGEQPENTGSTSFCDVDCLQAMSRRIHFGKFVAEAKFQAETERFTKMIRERDVDGIMAAITNQEVEDKILERLVKKGELYGTDPMTKYSQRTQSKVDPERIVEIYKTWIIPLTKQVEVEYLLRRLE